jgi:hypothetical protein
VSKPLVYSDCRIIYIMPTQGAPLPVSGRIVQMVANSAPATLEIGLDMRLTGSTKKGAQGSWHTPLLVRRDNRPTGFYKCVAVSPDYYF